MFNRIRRLIPLCAAILLALVCTAISADWRVAQTTGRAFVQQGSGQLASLSRGLVLENGAVIVTEKNGKAAIVRGSQTMIVSPNTVVTLPAEKNGMTTIVQSSGEIQVDVDRRQNIHFSVETPYLSAVVKGTKFTVQVRNRRANVGVYRGRVEVKNLKSGETVDILPGQRGYVNSFTGISIDGVGDIQPVMPGVPRAAIVDRATAKQVLSSLSRSTSANTGKAATSVGKGKEHSSEARSNRSNGKRRNGNNDGGGGGDGGDDGGGGDDGDDGDDGDCDGDCDG